MAVTPTTEKPPVPIPDERLKQEQTLALSLSGCGFLGTYHFGASACLYKHGKSVLDRTRIVGGASVGSLVAALLVLCPEKLPQGLEQLFDLADELNSLKLGALTPGFSLADRLERIVATYLPEDISTANNKLFVSLTTQKGKSNLLKSEYKSKEHLLKCLSASCYIPMYSAGFSAEAPVVDDEACIDGGISNNLPVFNGIRTVTISPFSGSAEISPLDSPSLTDWTMTLGNQEMKVNVDNAIRGAQALFPPTRKVLGEYFDRGFMDAFRWLKSHEILERDVGTPV